MIPDNNAVGTEGNSSSFLSFLIGKSFKPKGIYVHVPFCHIKCPYCDFLSGIPPDDELTKRYFLALKKEFLMYSELLDFSQCSTLYFGGGTPGLFPSYLSEFTDFLRKFADFEEISVEVNPSSHLLPSDFSFATRISFGVQTFSEKHLRFLGRNHSFYDSISCLENFSPHFSVNADLIFGIPEQSPSEHLEDLKIALNSGVKHISAYLLTPYENTPLGVMVKRGLVKLPEDIEAFFDVQSYLEELGMIRYEISNFAFDGNFCKHNLLYWNRDDFLGIGVSSWSKLGDIRFANTKNLKLYLSGIEKGIFPVDEIHHISKKEELYEIIFLGIRKVSQGVDIFNLNIDSEKFLKLLFERGLMQFLDFCDGKIKIKKKFLSIADFVIREIFDVLDRITFQISEIPEHKNSSHL